MAAVEYAGGVNFVYTKRWDIKFKHVRIYGQLFPSPMKLQCSEQNIQARVEKLWKWDTAIKMNFK